MRQINWTSLAAGTLCLLAAALTGTARSESECQLPDGNTISKQELDRRIAAASKQLAVSTKERDRIAEERTARWLELFRLEVDVRGWLRTDDDTDIATAVLRHLHQIRPANAPPRNPRDICLASSDVDALKPWISYCETTNGLYGTMTMQWSDIAVIDQGGRPVVDPRICSGTASEWVDPANRDVRNFVSDTRGPLPVRNPMGDCQVAIESIPDLLQTIEALDRQTAELDQSVLGLNRDIAVMQSCR